MTTNTRSKKLIINIFLFFIGGMGAKIIQFILLPMYTRVLSNTEYGTIDLLQTIVTLLLPIITVSVAEAVFRFGMDCSINSYFVLRQSLIIATTGLGIGSLVIGFVYFFINKNLLLPLLAIQLVTAAYKTILSQYIRSQKRIKLYVTDNLCQTFIICTVNIIAIIYFKLGVWGYFSGYIIANMFSIILLSIKTDLFHQIKTAAGSDNLGRKLLNYSVPLIPNSICWWISNSLDRVMVSAMLGVSQNGILAVAYKIPNMISLMFDFFIQAWQMSLNEEIDANQKSDFHNVVFQYVSIIIFIISFLAMFLSNYLLPFVVGQSFIIAQKYIPLFSLAIVFFSFAQYLGTFFSAYKKTAQAFYTNLAASVSNIFLNVCLIPDYGLYGAAFATLFSYILLWLIRIIKLKTFVIIQYSAVFWLSLIILCIQTFLISVRCDYIALLLELILFILNYKTIKGMLSFILKNKKI